MKNKSTTTLFLALLLMVALPACKGVANNSQQSSDSTTVSQQEIYQQKMLENPASQVVDVAGILTTQDIDNLIVKTDELDSLNLAQVAIVTVNDLEGKAALDFATDLANKWGVGHKATNDGITIVIKPKTADAKGEAAIATGTGMEKLLSNEMCKRIIDEVMIPKFKENKYGEAISDTIDKIKELLTQHRETI